MWPAALGGQEIHWDARHSGYVLTDSARQFAAVILAPGAIAEDEPLNNTRSLAGDELAMALDKKLPEILFAEIEPKPGPASAWDPEIESAGKLLTSKEWEQESVSHYQELTKSELQIETPDGELNHALAWAEIALDQDWVCSDKLGCGYLGGFGPSRRNRRPQYAWYFAGDGMIAMHGALAVGDIERAREELRFIAKYQDAQSGMIWHELSQSAPYIDWRGKYPYMFVHADLTYPYISAVADYVRASGDREFLKEMWPSVQKAFAYGRSLIGSNGLPQVPAGKEGADEQNPLLEELGLSTSWVEACADYAHLADLSGNASAAAEAKTMAEKARAAFAKRYWDTRRNFAIVGFHRDGSPVMDRGLGAISGVSLHLFTDAEAFRVLDEIASWRFQSDWGTRSVAMGEAGFDPTLYAHGSVWGLGTADVAQAYWAEHRPDTAWEIWRSLIPWSTLDSPGHMHEVLAGDTYHPQFESVPEQTWSSVGFLSAAVHGLLGLDVDAEKGRLTLAPHLPADWNKVSFRGVKVGNSALDFELQQTLESLMLHITNRGENVRLAFRPEIPLGARAIRASVGTRKIEARVEAHQQDQHVAIDLEVPKGEFDVTVRYRDGVALVMASPRPLLGEPSKGMKVKDVALTGDSLKLNVDFVPAESTNFSIRTSRTIESAAGVDFKRTATETYELSIHSSSNAASHDYESRQIAVNFKR
jgi:hypothetical protein